MGRKSISQRLKAAKTPEVKQEAALDWAANWQAEQANLIKMLEQAIKNDDYDQLCIATGQLKAVSEKRFDALSRVIRAVGEAYEGDTNESTGSRTIRDGL